MSCPEVRIDWLLAADARAAWLDDAERWLDDDERARLGRFRVAGAARDFLLGRWLMRRALAARTGVPAARWRFSIETHGRPVPVAPAGSGRLDVPRVNLTHGGGLVACASSAELEIGIDVEAVDRVMPGERLDRFLTPDEVACLSGVPDPVRDDRFWRIWTLKEAVLKARGTGIAGTLASAPIRLDPADGSAHADGGWFLLELRPTARHRLALAASAADRAPTVEVRTVGE